MAKMKFSDINTELTTSEIAELNALDNRDIIFDDDCPEMTTEQLKQFRRVKRNKPTVSIRLSPQTFEKAKSLGKGYTSILSRLLDMALNDENMVRKCL